MPCCRSATRWAGSSQSGVSRSPMWSMKTGGASLTGICSDPRASCVIAETAGSTNYQPRLSSRIDPEGVRKTTDFHTLGDDTLTGSQATVFVIPEIVQPYEIGILVRSTAGLMFREKYSFLTLHP